MAGPGEIKILGTASSPYVDRVLLVLNLKSIDYELIEENLACKSDLLLASNPVYKLIPVLHHANKPPICESLVIIEYLDEIRPHVHRILPSDPWDRANSRFWATYIDHKFFPLFKELRERPGQERTRALKNKLLEASNVLERVFEKLSKGKAYFGGDEMGYMDVVLGCFLGWIRFTEQVNRFKVFDEVRTPRLANWERSMWSHEVVNRVIPGNEALMKFYSMLQTHKVLRSAY